jgi:Xaa-Pro aminopeptidase
MLNHLIRSLFLLYNNIMMHFKLFSADVYRERRAALQRTCGKGVAIFLGNNESPRNYKDNTFHFRQDSTFLYYFGLPVAGLAAVMDFDSGECTIYGDELTIDDIVWTGPLPSVADMAQAVGVLRTQRSNNLRSYMDTVIGQNRSIHYLPIYRHDLQIKMAYLIDKSINEVLDGYSHTMRMAVIDQRLIKEDREIAEMHKATLITSSMHEASMAYGRPGVYEYEIAAKVHEAAIKGGGELAFSTIMTVRGETLHNHYHGNLVREGHLILCDAGAENDMNYCGDMTSTYPASRAFTTKQADVYNVVLRAQEECVAMLRPGIKYLDVYYHSCRVILDGMKTLGLVHGDTEELLHKGAYGMFLQCGLGHMIGLDVHDMENLGEQYVGYTPDITRSTQFGMKYLRLTREMKAGYVVTVEPGIYFIPTLIDMWRQEAKWKDVFNFDLLDTYKDFGGIRIEEDIVITADSHRLLGRRLPKTIQEIEAFRAPLFS